ncbi:MAG: hypothetical protein CVU06_14410, partial [Bacteroidetes bacterium HGW-Bacteroidetes-22]
MSIQVNKLKKEPEVTPEPEPKEKSPKKKPEKKQAKSSEGFKLSQRQRTIIGAFVLLLAVYLMLAQISYIFTWDSDYDQIDSVSLSQ